MNVLITGAAGFIGSSLAARLLERGDAIFGIDNLSDYYDVSLKEVRLERLRRYEKFEFEKLDVADRKGMERLFSDRRFDAVMSLAAQAGVRYSLENPHPYIQSNVVGFCNIILEVGSRPSVGSRLVPSAEF